MNCFIYYWSLPNPLPDYIIQRCSLQPLCRLPSNRLHPSGTRAVNQPNPLPDYIIQRCSLQPLCRLPSNRLYLPGTRAVNLPNPLPDYIIQRWLQPTPCRLPSNRLHPSGTRAVNQPNHCRIISFSVAHSSPLPFAFQQAALTRNQSRITA